MSRCLGPRAAGIKWDCDTEHGIVDGRCAECRIMAEAGSNLSLGQIDAIRAPAVLRQRRSERLREAVSALVELAQAWDSASSAGSLSGNAYGDALHAAIRLGRELGGQYWRKRAAAERAEREAWLERIRPEAA
jgi:biotin carboxylase